jgi:copper(I)-binding protein
LETLVRHPFVVFAVALTLLSAAPSPAQQAPTIEIVAPWARATAGTAKTGAAYMTLRNAGHGPDRLVGASTPAAGRAELHTHVRDGDVMRMRKIDSIEMKPDAAATLAPGGLHVMLFDLKAPLKEGDRFSLTLKFEKAGEIAAQVLVRSATATDPGGHGGHHHSH